MSDWKPAGYTSVSPYLICADAEAAIAFMQAAFEGELVRRFDRPDGSLMHAEVRIDDTIVMIGGAQTPESATGPHVHVYVLDAGAAFARAVAFGAEPVQEPMRKRSDDDLRGGVRDAAGTTWWIATV